MNESPADPLVPAPPRVFPSLAGAWRALRSAPVQTLVPMLAVNLVVGAVSAAAIIVLYLFLFPESEIDLNLLDASPRSLQFALLALTAFQGLLAQVARGATVVGVAAVARGARPPLTEVLDPAFTRLGGLLALGLLLLGIFALLSLHLVGLLLAPFLLARLGVATEALILEARSAPGALLRSWQLTGGHTLRLVLLFLIVGALGVLGLLVGAVLEAVEAPERTSRVLLLAAARVIGSVALVFPLAFGSAAITLYYLALRKAEQEQGGLR